MVYSPMTFLLTSLNSLDILYYFKSRLFRMGNRKQPQLQGKKIVSKCIMGSGVGEKVEMEAYGIL